MSTKRLSNIVREYLESRGCDGLCGDGCGCGLDDLFSCGYPDADCMAAKARPCLGRECPSPCDGYDGGEPLGVCYYPADIPESDAP